MRYLREYHLIDPMTKYNPDVPEPGDMVRVYQSVDSEYYIIGEVISWDDDKETYLVEYVSRHSDLYEKIEAYWNLVETESIGEKNVNR